MIFLILSQNFELWHSYSGDSGVRISAQRPNMQKGKRTGKGKGKERRKGLPTKAGPAIIYSSFAPSHAPSFPLSRSLFSPRLPAMLPAFSSASAHHHHIIAAFRINFWSRVRSRAYVLVFCYLIDLFLTRTRIHACTKMLS